jgi:hypothetical protein
MFIATNKKLWEEVMGAYSTAGGGVMYTQIVRKDKNKEEQRKLASRRESHYKSVSHNLYHGQINHPDKRKSAD